MAPTARPPTSAHAARHRHRGPRRRTAVAGASLVLLGVAAVGTAAFAGGGAGTGCAGEPLEVWAAPEVAPAVETAASFLRCPEVVVTAAQPHEVAQELASGKTELDVWVPDSSSWLTAAQRAGAGSVAWSPVVLSVPADSRLLRGAATLEEVAVAAAADGRVVVGAPDPATSAPTRAVVTMLRDSLGSTPAHQGSLATLLRAGLAAPEEAVDVRPTTEQQVWATNQDAATADAVRAVRPAAAGRAMDYPYLVTSADPRSRRGAAALRDVLTGSTGQAVLEGLGFRSVTEQGAPAPLTSTDSRSALALLESLARPSRVLALVDVSGSMDRPVPGTRLTRMQLAREALDEGLSLFPHGTVAGLWRFSSELTPSSNYEQVAPMAPLTPATRRRLTGAVGGLTAVPLGGTGLYDSVLAAVRHVRAGYDRDAVNSVVVLSDGRDEAASAHGITKQALLRALRAEADPERPVVVITVAYGPDSDTAALRAISDVTGGTLHVARDPRDLPVIFRDALGGRVTR